MSLITKKPLNLWLRNCFFKRFGLPYGGVKYHTNYGTNSKAKKKKIHNVFTKEFLLIFESLFHSCLNLVTSNYDCSSKHGSKASLIVGS